MRKPSKAQGVPPEVANSPKVVGAVVSMVIAQAISDALAKGYQLVLVPGGDPAVWRDLAARASALIDNLPATIVATAPGMNAWQAEYEATVAVFTLQTHGVGGSSVGDAAGDSGLAQPTPKPPGSAS